MWTSTIKKYFSDVQLNINEITNFDVNKKKNPDFKKDKSIPLKKTKLDDKKE